MRRVLLLVIAIGVLSFPGMAADDPSDASTPAAEVGEVVFGQSAALSGPASELGTGMRLGLESAFVEVNANGGVHGRHLVLRSLDDSYEPEAAVANTRELIDEHDVFALVGAVGTPDLPCCATGHPGRRRALHRPVHGSGVSSRRQGAVECRQCACLLLPGDCRDRRATDPGSRHRQDRHPVPRRLLRAGGTGRRPPCARCSRSAPRRGGQLPPQYRDRQTRLARPAPLRPGSRGHHRCLQTRGDPDSLGPEGRLQADIP